MKYTVKNISNIFFVLLALGLLAQPALANDLLVNNQITENITKAINNFRARPAFFNKAKLIEVNDKTLTVEYNKATYKVLIMDKTKLMRRYGGEAKLVEFKPGQILLVSGKRIAQDTIEARLIHNWSIEKYWGSYVGVVDKVILDNKALSLKTSSRGVLEVTLDDSVKILYRNETKNLSDLIVGAKIVVVGMWDKNGKTISEVQKIVLLSSPTDKPVGMKQRIKQEIASFGREIKKIETETVNVVGGLIK